LIRADTHKYGTQFNRDGTDREFERLIDRDVAALNKVADAVERGDVRSGYRRWAKLDSVVRESLSQRAWRGLTNGAAIGHTEYD